MKLIIILILFPFAAFSQVDSTEAYDFGKWGLGAEIGPCSGMFFLTGKSKDKINEGWCFASVGLTGTYKKIHIMLQTGGLNSTIKEDFSLRKDWKKSYFVASVNFQSFVGYELLSKKNFNIIPFISGGVSSIGVADSNETDLKNKPNHYFPSYSLGVVYDFKINLSVRKDNQFPGYEYVVQYLYFRVLTGVYPNHFQKSMNVDGNLYFINLSFGGHFKPMKRK